RDHVLKGVHHGRLLRIRATLSLMAGPGPGDLTTYQRKQQRSRHNQTGGLRQPILAAQHHALELVDLLAVVIRLYRGDRHAAIIELHGAEPVAARTDIEFVCQHATYW